MILYFIVQFWSLLVAVSLLLISLRKDSRIIFEDILSYYKNKSFVLNMLTSIMLYFALPFTIIYSISYFTRKK
jgi:hypothetical protein